MIGGNKQFSFFRAVTTRNAIKEKVTTYPADNPLYKNVWCRKVQRVRQDRLEIHLTDYAQPLLEEFLLIIPSNIAIQERDLARQKDTSDDYLILGVEDTSGMDQSFQCPIVRVENATKVAS